MDPLGLLEMQNCPGYPSGAGLCCKGGSYVMCTDFSWWYKQSPGFRQCTVEHEEYHVWQMQWDPKPKCGECTGQPCTTLKPPKGTGAKRECAAYLNMYVCLQKNAPYHQWVPLIWEYIDRACLSYPDFGGFM